MEARKHILTISILTLILAAPAALAEGPVFGSASVDFPTKAAQAGTLTVSGPGVYFNHSFKAGAVPSFSLFDKAGERLADGLYKWSWQPHPAKATGPRDGNHRGLEAVTGSFRIEGGAVVDKSLREGGLLKDQVILDDLIVDGSICAGQDCVNGESFGFDTLRLKENNLRIKFQDTSSSASFPTNDWQLTANESSNGGLNKFSIDDIDGGRIPFTIEAGARTNALYVEADGDIGIGTNNPVADVHIVSGNTPTLRLEQDGSNGFAAQTWDLAGNEANIFIRDATNGSTLPFRIRPGAPTSAIDVAASGHVGLGTGSPQGDLHIADGAAAAAPRIILEDNGSTGGVHQWNIRVTSAGTFRIEGDEDATPNTFDFQAGGNLVLSGGTVRTNLSGAAGAGTDACIGSDGSLCICGSCS